MRVRHPRLTPWFETILDFPNVLEIFLVWEIDMRQNQYARNTYKSPRALRAGRRLEEKVPRAVEGPRAAPAAAVAVGRAAACSAAAVDGKT